MNAYIGVDLGTSALKLLLMDAEGKILRLIFLDPKHLGGGKAGKGDIGGEGRELFFCDDIVEVVHLLSGSAVVPEDGRTNHIIIFVQDHQAVHLATAADTGNILAVKAFQQLGDTLHYRLMPILGRLLAPTRLGKLQGVFSGNHIFDLTFFVHQQQLHGRSTQINANI